MMSQDETWTIRRLLEWTTGYLQRSGADSPRLDAEILLAHALGCKRIDLYANFDTEPNEKVRTAYRELIKRRAANEPVAYLVGYKEFYSMRFAVGNDVLIPRPETEYLVIGVKDLVEKMRAAGLITPDRTADLCDIGTGSGAIAVTLAKHVPKCRVTAIDLSEPALVIARANAVEHDVAARIEFLQGDLLAPVEAGRQFDIIASNPPYVTEAEYELLAPDILNHEPRGALVAGADGLDVIRRLIPQAAAHLRPGGYLLIEISPMIHDSAVELISSEASLQPCETILDLDKNRRVIVGRKL